MDVCQYPCMYLCTYVWTQHLHRIKKHDNPTKSNPALSPFPPALKPRGDKDAFYGSVHVCADSKSITRRKGSYMNMKYFNTLGGDSKGCHRMIVNVKPAKDQPRYY